MKGEKIRALLKKNSVRVGGVVLAAAVALGSFWALDTREAVPELVTYVDTDGNVEIKGEAVPLAAPKVTKTTKTQKKTKKIKMKKKSKKTYVKKQKSTKKQTKTTSSSSQKTQVVTVINTNIVNNYKKNSNINRQVTTTKTTTTTTVTTYEQPSQQSSTLAQGTQSQVSSTQPQAAQQSTGTTQVAQPRTTAQTPSSSEFTAAGEYSVAQAAPLVNAKVANAFQKMGFKIVVNPGVSYAGLFDSRSQSITMKRINATIYHELGHFVAFLAGNYDLSVEFKAIFEKEKALYTMTNKAYVLQNSAEYFAESFKNYTLEPEMLKATRPETFQAMELALSRVTDDQVNKYISAFQGIWSKNQ